MVPVKPTVKPPPPTSKPPPPKEPSCKPPPKPLLPASKPLVCNIYAAPNSVGSVAGAGAASKPNISLVKTAKTGDDGENAAATGSSKSKHAAQNGDSLSLAVKLPAKCPPPASSEITSKITGDRTPVVGETCVPNSATAVAVVPDGQTSNSDTRANSTDSGLSSAVCEREWLMELSQSLQNLLAGLEREELTTQAAMSVSDKVSGPCPLVSSSVVDPVIFSGSRSECSL